MYATLEAPQPTMTTSDGELFERSREGSEAAFTALVERHKDGLVGYLFRLVGDRERAEDFAQEAFLRLYHRSGSYREQGQLKAYLFRIATNLVRSEGRRSQRWLAVRSLLGGAEIAPDPSPFDRTARAELRQALENALVELPLRYKAPIVLRELRDWSYQEIAEALDCSIGTVKSRLHRARRILRERLESDWPGNRGAGNSGSLS